MNQLFTVNHIQNQEKSLNCLELKSPDGLSSAKIELAYGGSVQELFLNTKQIIKCADKSKYLTSYTSSILFPYVNRMKDGKYEYEGKEYQLEINFPHENNAIHGLVFCQEFEFVKKEISSNYAEVTLKYSETSKPKGFPFDYTVFLTYKLTATTLEIEVKAENNDTTTFPFSMGWHPYFHTSNLHDSYLKMKSSTSYAVCERNIPVKEKPNKFSENFQIKDIKFDDCFVLDANKVGFITPDYEIDFTFSAKNDYLQLYTPDDRESFAIEPLTSAADCFNNKIGLQFLQPKEAYNVNWTIELKNEKN